MRPFDDTSINALISLLTDDNPRVFSESRRTLRAMGDRALPFLESAEGSEDALLRARARIVKEDVRVFLLESELDELVLRLDHNEDALERCCTLLARSRFPELETESIRAALDAMADDLAGRIHGLSSQLARARTLARFLLVELGFQGNQRNYYDPDNSYLNRVLERRTGIPITLSAVYLFVGRRLGLPLFGIGMPGHFVLRYGRRHPAIFIDAFMGGKLLTEADCLKIVQNGDRRYNPKQLVPMTDADMLLRMIRNLQLIYRNRGEGHRLTILERLQRVLLREEVPTDSDGAGAEGGSSF